MWRILHVALGWSERLTLHKVKLEFSDLIGNIHFIFSLKGPVLILDCKQKQPEILFLGLQLVSKNSQQNDKWLLVSQWNPLYPFRSDYLQHNYFNYIDIYIYHTLQVLVFSLWKTILIGVVCFFWLFVFNINSQNLVILWPEE